MERNKEKITPELAKSVNLLFLPKTVKESLAIQQALFDIGFAWAAGNTDTYPGEEVTRNGLVLFEGKLYPRGENDPRKYSLATLDQLKPGYTADDREFLKEQFAKINARLDRIEKRVAEIHDVVYPKEIDKPVIKMPTPSTGVS